MKKITIGMAMAVILFHTATEGDSTFVHLEYQHVDFDHSKQKRNGRNVVAHIGLDRGDSLYEAAYTRTDTKTFQPPLPENLKVDKYYLKYTYRYT